MRGEIGFWVTSAGGGEAALLLPAFSVFFGEGSRNTRTGGPCGFFLLFFFGGEPLDFLGAVLAAASSDSGA